MNEKKSAKRPLELQSKLKASQNKHSLEKKKKNNVVQNKKKDKYDMRFIKSSNKLDEMVSSIINQPFQRKHFCIYVMSLILMI